MEITTFVIVGLTAFACAVSAGCGSAPMPAAEAAGDSPGSDAATQDDYDYWHRPTLATDYDDIWVENVPDVISGYEVIYISTPKNTVCNGAPIIGLRAHQKSIDEFMRSPPSDDVFSIVDSLPGVPPNVRLSFFYSSTPTDKEEDDVRHREWNAKIIEKGSCPERWGGASDYTFSTMIEVKDPDWPGATDIEIDD